MHAFETDHYPHMKQKIRHQTGRLDTHIRSSGVSVVGPSVNVFSKRVNVVCNERGKRGKD
jgi:hypothetical protein